MKKILIACGSTQFPEAAFDFVRKLNARSAVQVTGLFLPEYDLSHLWLLSDPVFGQTFIQPIEEEEINFHRLNIDRFNNLCKRENIKYSIHDVDSGMATSLIKKESRFADFLIIDSNRFYEYMGTGSSNPSLKDSLHDAECPVIITPGKGELPIKTMLSYDGSESSVFAIKQFAYLLPEFKDNETLLVYASDSNSSIPNESDIMEWAQQHFSKLKVIHLDVKSKNVFNEWVEDGRNTIAVLGSYGRSLFSQLFTKSFASDLINEHKFLLFIAHR